MMKIYEDLEQGSPEWLEARRGIITASEVGLLVTPTGKIANNEKVRTHQWELMAQRISGYVEPMYISDDMLRGIHDEVIARDLYSQHYVQVDEVGFITNDFDGVTIGYSPDGLVADDGLIEIKSRRQKYQVQTIATDEVPSEYMYQLQCGLLVTGREWIDFISYSAGLPMFVKRVYPDAEMQGTILDAAREFEINLGALMLLYEQNADRFIETDRNEDDFDFGGEE